CCSCRKSSCCSCCSQALIGTLFLRKKWLAGNCEPFFCIKPESVTVRAFSSGNSRSTWPDVATIESATNLLRWQLNRRRCKSRGVAARNGPHCHGFPLNQIRRIIMERTFAIIKPDAVERNLIGKVLD